MSSVFVTSQLRGCFLRRHGKGPGLSYAVALRSDAWSFELPAEVGTPRAKAKADKEKDKDEDPQ